MLLGLTATYLLLVCSPFVYYYSENGFELFVTIFACACTLDGVLVFVAHGKAKPSSYAKWLEYISLFSVVITIVIWQTTTTVTWNSTTLNVPIVITCATLVRFGAKAVAIPTDEQNSLRRLTFYLCMSFVNIVAAFLIHELGSILSHMTLEESTLRCEQTTHSSTSSTTSTTSTTSIIFSDKMDFTQCPLDLWKLIRLNAILGVQIYVMFTLTTTIPDEAGIKKARAIGISSLAFMECLLLSVAVVTQFDTLYKCYVFSAQFFVCIMIAISCCFCRYLLQENGVVSWLRPHNGTLPIKKNGKQFALLRNRRNFPFKLKL